MICDKERNESIVAMRESGATFQQIAEAHKITRARVQQIVARSNCRDTYVRKRYAPRRCAWPVIGRWMDQNRTSTNHLSHMVGCCYAHMYDVLNGRVRLNKDDIDGILAATGLTYEEAFRKE